MINKFQPDLGTHSKVNFRKGDTIDLSIQVIRPDCTFQAKDKRFGTIYECKLMEVNDDTFNVLKKLMFGNGGTFMVNKQSDTKWTNIEVDLVLN